MIFELLDFRRVSVATRILQGEAVNAELGAQSVLKRLGQFSGDLNPKPEVIVSLPLNDQFTAAGGDFLC